MDCVGCQEVLLFIMQLVELWEELGRYSQYGFELMCLKDCYDWEFVFGLIYEEVVIVFVCDEVNFYRKLFFMLYQIGIKFWDEWCLRFGLLCGCEFIMKDVYFFVFDWEELDYMYQVMNKVYLCILECCGLEYICVEVDVGIIGGQGEIYEFMVLVDVGEDMIVFCKQCGYVVNFEKVGYQIIGVVMQNIDVFWFNVVDELLI